MIAPQLAQVIFNRTVDVADARPVVKEIHTTLTEAEVNPIKKRS